MQVDMLSKWSYLRACARACVCMCVSGISSLITDRTDLLIRKSIFDEYSNYTYIFFQIP